MTTTTDRRCERCDRKLRPEAGAICALCLAAPRRHVLASWNREGDQGAIGATTGLRYEFNGSLTVNIYRGAECVDMFTMGEPDTAEFADVLDSIERREACAAGKHDEIRDDGSCDYCGEQVHEDSAIDLAANDGVLWGNAPDSVRDEYRREAAEGSA
jgi:hypothetical protein